MGCCMSTNNKAKCKNKSESSQLQKLKASSKFNESRAPPPSSEEDFSVVKEVVISVNQTPLVKPKEEEEEEEVSISEASKSKPVLDLDQQDKPTQKVPVFAKIKDTHLLYSKKAQSFNCTTPTDVSEVSEICSVSTTTTATTARDHIDFEEVSQRRRPVNSRSPATGGRNRAGVGKSPNRRSDQSPMRRNGSGQNQGMVKRVGSKSDLNKKDPGERSSRMRSRSPASNRSSVVMGRSQSPAVKRSIKSPGRVRPAESRKMEEGSGNNNNKGVSNNNNTNESLENPLVSLECFIFL